MILLQIAVSNEDTTVRPSNNHLNDPQMYEVVEESVIVTKKSVKRKRDQCSQLEDAPKSKRTTTAKCRGVYGIEKRELWCKDCKNKKRCTKFVDQ